MVKNFTLILLCQLTGEILTRCARLPVPGPVIGMVILFFILLRFKKCAPGLEKAGSVLLKYLPLFFVPAGVGVIVFFDLIRKSWAPITSALLIGTLITIAVSGLVMKLMVWHRGQGKKENLL